jgi:predicted protein tyrosine phosphatase
MSEIVITILAERPEHREALYGFADAWPEFMHGGVRQGGDRELAAALLRGCA